MTNAMNDCCRDYERAAGLSRRRFLAGMGAATGAAVATTMFGDAVRSASFGAASAGTGDNVLVVLSLRGGVDGLGLVVPHGDPGYYAARPNLAVPRASLLAADPMFGLHPSMAPLEWLWNSGEMAAIHAVGLPVPNRSHFSAIEQIEDADPTSDARRGWVNRMVGLSATGDPVEATALGTNVMPAALDGSAPALSVQRLAQASLAGAADGGVQSQRRRQQLAGVWSGVEASTTPILQSAYTSAVETVDLLAPVAAAKYTPSSGVSYPTGDLSLALQDSAQLIKANLGADVIAIDYGSWDMHSGYGSVSAGRMPTMITGLATALDAFMRDLGALRSNVTVVTISEFGRRIAENGNRGLDHGWGNMMLVAGAGIRGGKYYGSWTPLASGRDDDLQVTTDYRDVLSEIVARQFPERSLSAIFPAFRPTPVGFTG